MRVSDKSCTLMRYWLLPTHWILIWTVVTPLNLLYWDLITLLNFILVILVLKLTKYIQCMIFPNIVVVSSWISLVSWDRWSLWLDITGFIKTGSLALDITGFIRQVVYLVGYQWFHKTGGLLCWISMVSEDRWSLMSDINGFIRHMVSEVRYQWFRKAVSHVGYRWFCKACGVSSWISMVS